MRGESEIENNLHVNSRLLGDWEKITFLQPQYLQLQCQLQVLQPTPQQLRALAISRITWTGMVPMHTTNSS